MSACDMCQNGTVCRYREEFEKLWGEAVNVTADIHKKMPELPDFCELSTQFTCKHFRSNTYLSCAPGPLSNTPLYPSPPAPYNQISYNPIE